MTTNDNDLNLSPAIIVIFGITGDLSMRKLLPSLYELEKNKLLHEKTRIIGITRQDQSVDDIMKKAEPGIRDSDGRVSHDTLDDLTAKLSIYTMNSAESSAYPGLRTHLDSIEEKVGLCMNWLFYLSVPPQISMPIIRNLGQNDLNLGCGNHRAGSHLLMEKPFGFDMTTAKELIETTREYFEESQIFRIDHYLAKETVLNIVAFRFRNPIFEGIWDKKQIKSIEIVADEKLDIEGRANFYEQVGAMRDLIQSHLLHILSVILMDQPNDITNPKDMHARRLAVLESIEPVPADKMASRVVRGQYDDYLKEVDNQDSKVETFAALQLYSRDDKWREVPIILRTGKALSQKRTAVTITFKPEKSDHDHTNQLIFNIQPNESIIVELWVKKPGFKRELQIAPMEFSYEKIFDDHGHPDAYERVLVDAIRGDNTLFATSEEIMASWRILQPVLDHWAATNEDMHHYKKGSAGPSLEAFGVY